MPESDALISLDQLKEFMEIVDSDHDAFLGDMVDRVTSLFEGFTQRKLKARDYSYDSDSANYDPDNAVLNGNDRDRIMLPQYPVNSVTTVMINTVEIDERPGLYSVGWVIENKSAGILTLSGYIFSRGLKNIELEYNAGYATVPDELQHAAVEQAAWMFKQAPVGGGLLGVAAKTLADGSISYTTKDLLPQVRMVLDRYRRRIVL